MLRQDENTTHDRADDSTSIFGFAMFENMLNDIIT